MPQPANVTIACLPWMWRSALTQHTDPSRRKTVIDAALNLADELSTTQMELLHSVAQSAGEALNK